MQKCLKGIPEGLSTDAISVKMTLSQEDKLSNVTMPKMFLGVLDPLEEKLMLKLG